jgi:hypothetical protein
MKLTKLRRGALAAALVPMVALAVATPSSASAAKKNVVHVHLVGKIDATTGAPGGFTGKDGWPALSPSNFTLEKGHKTVLTIKEYDNMNTALPAGSPYNAVQGGVETVNGKRITSVSNAIIAHTLTIPQLGVNVPLPKAPMSPHNTKFVIVTFTFTPTQTGTFEWKCFTPCGTGAMGMMGPMQVSGWMTGTVTVK